MKRIKSFNESMNGEIWIVLVTNWKSEVIMIESFNKEFDAADLFINLVNKYWRTDFEPMKEGAERLFLDVNENEDYTKAINAIEYARTHSGTWYYWPSIYKSKVQ